MLLLVMMMVAAGMPGAAAGPNLCSQNLIPSNTTYMQFTKEPIPTEYGFQGSFKSIHCCVKGYRSIEWFKDGVPYPWPAGLSSFILYPEAGNQTLYVRRASRSDSGDYICRITNQTYTEDHHIKLDIMSKLTNAPKMMYVTKDMSVELGKPLRLFCEALIDRTHLADAVSDLKWKRFYPNGTEAEFLPSQKEINTTREDVQNIYGSYVIVEHMTPADYGQYACLVHSNNVGAREDVTVSLPSPPKKQWKGNKVPWRGLLVTGSLMASMAFFLGVVYRRCLPQLRLLARRVRALTTTQAERERILNKEFDVLVCWTPVDRDLVNGVLLRTLRVKYKYRVLGVQVPSEPDNWIELLRSEYQRSRSLLAVMSPSQYNSAQLLACLRQLREVSNTLVVALLQDLPELNQESKDSGKLRESLMKHSFLIPWRCLEDRQFWTVLRIALPMPLAPPPSPSSTQVVIEAPPATETEDRMKYRSVFEAPPPTETDDRMKYRSVSQTTLAI